MMDNDFLEDEFVQNEYEEEGDFDLDNLAQQIGIRGFEYFDNDEDNEEEPMEISF